MSEPLQEEPEHQFLTEAQLQQDYEELEAELQRIMDHPDFNRERKSAEMHTFMTWLSEHWTKIPPEKTELWCHKICARIGCTTAEFNLYIRNPGMVFSNDILYELLEEDSFLYRYLAYTRTHEAPEAYHLWVGMAILSAALNRNHWLGSDTHHFKIYPNLYVLLIGPPAETRKGGAMDIGIDLLMSACPKLKIAYHFTAESLIKMLGMPSTEKGKNGKVGGNKSIRSQALCFAPELKTVIGRERHKENIVGHLTELYDCQVSPLYSTVTRGAEQLKDVYLTFLGGTTENDFRSYIPQEATGGGFTSRLIMVVCPRTPRIATQDDAVRDLAMRNQLIQELQDIHLSAQGVQISNTDEGKHFFKNWYVRYKHDIADGKRSMEGQERFDLHVQKVAVLLSASEHRQQLTPSMYKRSIQLLESLGRESRHLIDSINTSPSGKLADRVKTTLRANGGDMSYTDLMRRLYRYYNNPQHLKDALTMLEQAKVIIQYTAGRGKRVKLMEGF